MEVFILIKSERKSLCLRHITENCAPRKDHNIIVGDALLGG